MQSIKLRDSDKDSAARLTQVDSRSRDGTRRRFRHQVAADMKAAGQLDSGEISAALGRLSDATKSTYGHANMSKGRGVAPARVTAARPVKMRAAAQSISKATK